MAQESERQRISRELHDVVGQDLSALKIGLDTFFDNQPEAPPETRQRLSEFSKILKGAIATVRDLSHTLRSTGLDHRGLVSTVRLYCEEFSDKNRVKVNFFATGIDESRLDFHTKINLYRMIQEGLNNVKKHADANHVTIRLMGSFPNIILRIEDDGKGFDVQDRLISAANERRMGLRVMEERAALLQGKMKIETYPKQGTKIVVEVPYKEKNIGRKENRLDC
jgi:signal transduction histidine kinase